MSAEPPSLLTLARRTLDHVSGVQVLGDWEWVRDHSWWSLHCRITIQNAGSGIPAESDWYILATADFPQGTIKFFPASNSPITTTYWHQNYNDLTPGSRWRNGMLCLDTSVHSLGRMGLNSEPTEAEERLRWHAERAVKWLEAAASETLIDPLDPFEMPDFRKNSDAVLAFNESQETFKNWESLPRIGVVDLLPIKRKKTVYITRQFRSITGEETYTPVWGDLVTNSPIQLQKGFWIALKALPVLTPWHPPMTWGELREACRNQGLNLNEYLKRIAALARGTSPILCIGFPVPTLFGAAPTQMYWKAFRLPRLTSIGTKLRGFRRNEAAWWYNDLSTRFQNSAPLEWISSENWDKHEIVYRGSFPKSLQEHDVLLIGAGALGASMAQMMVRSGTKSLTIVDEQVLTIGNLSRHPLSTDDIYTSKASSLAVRLRKISPHTHIHPIWGTFPKLSKKDNESARHCTLIIDTTGDDTIISSLQSFSWHRQNTIIISLSLGMNAIMLFSYADVASNFNREEFVSALAPWLAKQAEKYAGIELPREGIGCWHPVFPARADDVQLLASVAVKEVERVVTKGIGQEKLAVFEQTTDSQGNFVGIRKLSDSVDIS